jgi:RHS repeat-associated protein
MNCIKKYLKQHAILCYGLLAFANTLYAQGNYIRTYDATAPQQNATALMGKWVSDVKIATQYFDGLGRPIQTVVRQGSLETATGAIADVVSTNVYDALGREQFKYSPFVANNVGGSTISITDGNYKTNAPAQLQAFMTAQYGSQGETYFYAKTDFEPSPLNRPIKAMPIGNSWVGSNRGVEIKYWINTLTDDVKNWVVADVAGGFGTYALSTTSPIYNAGELTKNVSIDEHGKQVINFTDKEGKVILKKLQISNLAGIADDGTGRNHNGWLCTYYMYDDFNRLRCVIQPRAVELLPGSSWQLTNTTLLAEQCFRYEYDGRGRMIMKKVPGAGEVYMVYDSKDRLVMMQDANMRFPANNWLVTKYDIINRPIETGMWTNTTSFATHQINAAIATTDYPATTTSYEQLSIMHYDDYASVPAGLTASYNTGYNNNFATTDDATWPYPQMPVQSNATRGMVTWNKTKVLGTVNQFISNVIFYDDKGRAIQTQSINSAGGLDIKSNQYTWAGQPLVTVAKTEKAGINPQTSIVVSKISYDDLGRVLKTEKKIQNTLVDNNQMPAFKTIAQNQYDKLGQLKTKKLAPAYNNNAGLETLTYDYNIRGWVLGMNRDFISNPSSTSYFGMELAYDKTTAAATGTAYSAGKYNGNITGTIWKNKGDKVNRQYDFAYDNTNRLLRGDFKQLNDDNTWNNNTVNYNIKMGDGLNYNTAYDANGNIKQLQQWGLKINTSSQIDNLFYTYETNSNKLKNVWDASNDVATKLGDFKTNALHPQSAFKAGLTLATIDANRNNITDYVYDANGNLKKDYNKDIGNGTTDGIIYNYLNLPSVITVKKDATNNKGTITYTYDATSNKLKKVTLENPTTANNNKTITTTTNYINGLVYETKTTTPQDANSPPDYTDVLQFVPQEEGRIRFKPAVLNASGTVITPASFAYDYMLKDHLGNVRSVITDEQKRDIYPAATLEPSLVATENKFYTIDPGYIVPNIAANNLNNPSLTAQTYKNNNVANSSTNNNYLPVNNNPDCASSMCTTDNSAMVYRINGNANKIGLGITLRVMAGDIIDVYGKSYYYQANPNPGSPLTTNLLSSIITGFLGGATGLSATSVHGSVSPSNITTTSGINGAGGLFTNQNNQSGVNTNKPRAFINYIFFDDQFKCLGTINNVAQTGASIVGDNKIVKDHAAELQNLVAQKNGFVYIYCSNESNVDVFFDNLQVVHTRGAILEETHYYPFGMTMSGISSKAAGGLENKKEKFNGAELNTDFDLNTYEFFYRTYDPQIGRWHSLDTKPTDMISLYAAMANNPIRYADPLGDTLALFRPNGTFWKFQDDGKKEFSGMFYQNDKVTSSYTDANGVQYDVHEYSGGKAFEFNDPAIDVLGIKNGAITRVETMSDAQVESHIDKSGVKSPAAQADPVGFANQQGRQGNMDYGVKGLKSTDPSTKLNANTFYIRENHAYNVGDIGNYLWGRGMAQLGISLGTASMGAHVNNMFNGRRDHTPLYSFGPGTNGSPGLFDSQADQRAIHRGYVNNPKGAMLIKQELQNWPKYNPK